jgi:non-heme Fe2+,alpha-ketoglutarate-dependent halogenase
MRSLTAEQVAQFKRDGFLSPFPLLDEAERQACLEGLARYEAWLGMPVNAAQDLRWRTMPYIIMPWALRLATDPRVLDKVEDLLGPDLLLYTGTFFIKEPNTPTIAAWHQDSTYHGYEPMEQVNVWIALTDASQEAGCMEVLPFGGKPRLMPHQTHVVEHSVNRAGQRITEPFDESQAVGMPLQAGECSFHHGLCLHRSGPNTTSHRRIGLAFNYIPAFVKPSGSFAMRMMLVRGEDRWKHFGTIERPMEELGAQELEAHERAVTLYRETYREQEARHVARFGQGAACGRSNP